MFNKLLERDQFEQVLQLYQIFKSRKGNVDHATCETLGESSIIQGDLIRCEVEGSIGRTDPRESGLVGKED